MNVRTRSRREEVKMITKILMNMDYISVDTDDGSYTNTPIGKKIPVYRDGGPKDGARMGTATYEGLEEDGSPRLHVAADETTEF